MKIFERRKRNNGERELYLFGIKIFKYKRNIIQAVDVARKLGVKIGENVRLVSMPNWGSEPYFIEIGNDVLISFDCTFVTHDGCTHTCKQYSKDLIFKLGKINIGDNCFIGCKTTILPGVSIGNNCVVGACSVVTKSIPDGEVWAGHPAKFICKTEDLAHKLVESSKREENIQLYESLMKIRQKNI